MSQLMQCQFFYEGSGDHGDLHVLTPSYPTRRSSDLLADEPTGNLDESTADIVCAEFLQLVRGEGSAALGATHNERIAAKMDRVFRLHERSEEHTSELQSLMRISYAVFCLKKKNTTPSI